MRFGYRFAQFMAGRHGFDQMFRGLLFIALMCWLLNIIVPTNILRMVAYLLVIFAIFRALSRNIPRREAENMWYLTHVNGRIQALTQRDTKHYRYFKCPECGQVLRAPKGRGKIRVTCSTCHYTFVKKV